MAGSWCSVTPRQVLPCEQHSATEDLRKGEDSEQRIETHGCRCTRLTSLRLSMHEVESHEWMFAVDGLPEGITALQRLQHLRLANCLVKPLTLSISQLTQLTSLEILDEDLMAAGIHDDPNAVAVRWSSCEWCTAMDIPVMFCSYSLLSSCITLPMTTWHSVLLR